MRTNTDWIEFKGTRSTAMGVRVLKLPDRPRARMGGASVSVPGRSGSLFLPDGAFSDVQLSATLRLPAVKQTEVSSWLSGCGLLTASGIPALGYRARARQGYAYERIDDKTVQCTVVFDAGPYAYVQPPQTQIFYAGGQITNPYNAGCEPRITLIGSGDIALMIGSNILTIQGMSGEMVIDSEAGLAYSDGKLATSSISGDWPLIPPGGAMISWSGSVQKVTVEPNWRVL